MFIFIFVSFGNKSFPRAAVTKSSRAMSPREIQNPGEERSSIWSPMLIKAKVPGIMPMTEARIYVL